MGSCSGLERLVKEDEGETMPALFSDPLFQRTIKWALSTSAVFSEHIPLSCWVGLTFYVYQCVPKLTWGGSRRVQGESRPGVVGTIVHPQTLTC